LEGISICDKIAELKSATIEAARAGASTLASTKHERERFSVQLFSDLSTFSWRRTIEATATLSIAPRFYEKKK